MCYKCNVCMAIVPHGVARIVHRITRRALYKVLVSSTKSDHMGYELKEGVETEREIPVCKECKGHLDAKVSLDTLLRRYSKPQTIREEESPVQSSPVATNPVTWAEAWAQKKREARELRKARAREKGGNGKKS